MKRRTSLRPHNRLGSGGLNRGIAVPALGVGASHIGFAVIAIMLLALSILMPQKISGLRMQAADMFAPLLQTVTKPVTDVAEIVRNISGLGELQAENIRLQQENMKLREWYQTALLLEAENKSLRDLLQVKVEPTYQTITARVIADSGNTFAKSILVSAGAQDGVEKGQAVMSSEGLIGRVIEAGQKTARVLLITDINSRVPVLVENTRQHAVLAGHEQNNTKLVHLPPDSVIHEKSRIITSGHGGMFPPGLAIGRVKPAEAGHDIIVEPFADFSRIVHVRIVDKNEAGGLIKANPETAFRPAGYR